jgi:hypothetical protein
MSHSEKGDQQRRNPLRIAIWGTAVFLLLLPWVAMQFTAEVAWTGSDFVVFGCMLLLVCGMYELAAHISSSKAYRLAMGMALMGAFLLTWINLAVGIIGNEDNPANLLFFAVPAVGASGALLARFRSGGMARALVATAITQGLILLAGLIAGWGHTFPISGFFILLWLTSAQLFRRAAQEEHAGAPAAGAH